MTERKMLDEDDLVRKYLTGESIKQLAHQFSVSRPVITRRLIENKVLLRDQSESEAMKWSRMSDATRKSQVDAAHKAVRGRHSTFEQLCTRAIGIQVSRKMSGNEIILYDW